MTPAVLPGLDLLGGDSVEQCWALMHNGPSAIPQYTLHRFTNDVSQARTWPIDAEDQALQFIDPESIRVRLASNDHPTLKAVWMKVTPEMRTTLLGDPTFCLPDGADLPVD